MPSAVSPPSRRRLQRRSAIILAGLLACGAATFGTLAGAERTAGTVMRAGLWETVKSSTDGYIRFGSTLIPTRKIGPMPPTRHCQAAQGPSFPKTQPNCRIDFWERTANSMAGKETCSEGTNRSERIVHATFSPTAFSVTEDVTLWDTEGVVGKERKRTEGRWIKAC